jgi:hypothetical protein
MQKKLLEIISVDFNITGQPTTDHIFCTCQILEKIWKYNRAVHQLFIDFKKAYNLVRKRGLPNTVVEFGISMKLVRLIK